MKIVFVSDGIYPYLHGGKEKRLYELSTRLARLGHDVHIYTMHWWDGPESTHDEDGVHLHALCKQYEMYHGDRRTITEAVMFSLACLRLFQVQFDVLDVDHMPFFPVLSTWLVCALRRKKFYATWHEALTRQEWIGYMGVGGNIAMLIERICIRLPHAITASSEHTRERITQVLGRRRNIHLVTPGINVTELEATAPVPDQCDVLAVCRLVKDKNLDVLVRAIAQLHKTKPDITCTIVGKGPEQQRLRRLIKQLGLASNISILERLPSVYPYMKAARVFCIPSVREGFGIVFLEALGCGTPIITADSPTNAARLLVKNNQHGSVVAITENAIAEAIRFWLAKGKRSDTAHSVRSYDWNVLTEHQEGVYAA